MNDTNQTPNDKPTFGKHKFTVPREAYYQIGYPDGTTETKLLKIGGTYDLSAANSLTEIATPNDREAELREYIVNWLDINTDISTGGVEKEFADTLADNLTRGMGLYITQEQDALLRWILDEVVGRDATEEDDDTGKWKVNKYLVAENRLRRQQRTAINKKRKELE